jgi:hypothetical protein
LVARDQFMVAKLDLWLPKINFIEQYLLLKDIIFLFKYDTLYNFCQFDFNMTFDHLRVEFTQSRYLGSVHLMTLV